MTVTPSGQIYICKTPLKNDYKNQLTFSSTQAQYSYFSSKVQYSFDNYTYIKKDNSVNVGENIDKLINCNYLFYKNVGFTNKWYYCFITNMEYVNENCTRITFETDVFQTWYFQIKYNPCFVEREHVNDDTIGKNIVDENLQTSEYIANKVNFWLNDTPFDIETNTNLSIVIGATQTKDKQSNAGVQTDGIYAGLRYYVFHNNAQGISDLNDWLDEYATNGISEAIKCMFMIPNELVIGADREDHLYAGSNTTITRYINLINSSSSSNKNIDLTNNNIDGYTPKNNKLLTYPYNYLLASNNSGIDVVYKLEDFYSKDENGNKTLNNPSFKIDSCLTPSGSIRMVPLNYKGIQENDSEGINMGKFPVCNWDTDVYTNWLTQNGVNISLSIASSGITVASGVGMMATGGGALAGASSVVSGAMGIANTLGEIYKQSLIPPQSNGNINCGDSITATGKNDFIFYNMSIKKESAIIIDNYFSMFGYKVNVVKIPNITGRENWNYIKTIDCNCDGDIPQTDLQIIRQMFDNGVTLWHNPSNIYNYNLENNIV